MPTVDTKKIREGASQVESSINSFTSNFDEIKSSVDSAADAIELAKSLDGTVISGYPKIESVQEENKRYSYRVTKTAQVTGGDGVTGAVNQLSTYSNTINYRSGQVSKVVEDANAAADRIDGGNSSILDALTALIEDRPSQAHERSKKKTEDAGQRAGQRSNDIADKIRRAAETAGERTRETAVATVTAAAARAGERTEQAAEAMREKSGESYDYGNSYGESYDYGSSSSSDYFSSSSSNPTPTSTSPTTKAESTTPKTTPSTTATTATTQAPTPSTSPINTDNKEDKKDEENNNNNYYNSNNNYNNGMIYDGEEEKENPDILSTSISDILSQTKIPKIKEPIKLVPTQSNSNIKNVIPIAAGVAAATAVGVGAKAYMDRKSNIDNGEEEFDDYNDEEENFYDKDEEEAYENSFEQVEKYERSYLDEDDLIKPKNVDLL